MVKIMMHGCNGVMGQVISKIVEETEGAVMVCGVDRVDDGHNDYPVFTDINACDVEVDAIIDFYITRIDIRKYRISMRVM